MSDRASPAPHPGSGAQLAHYWTHGEGAKKIKWGVKGDFDRCVRQLMLHGHMTAEQAKGYCAERHHEALGVWPGQEHGGKKGRSDDHTPCVGCGGGHDVRALDTSTWDGSSAMSGCANAKNPASCYGSICAGRKSGDPSMQSSWALPHHARPGAPANVAAVRNALDRLSQTQGLTNADAARRHLEAHLNSQPGRSAMPAPLLTRDGLLERAVPFTMKPMMKMDDDEEKHGDGLTLSGYAAVFNSPTTIRDSLGEFTETIMPGAFRDSLAKRTPVLMFEHGRHPLVGSMPLGVIHRAEEDGHGLYIEARLTDNWLIQPVRDAVRDGAVDGMSFRFTVPNGGDSWNDTQTERSIMQLDCRELGPVVFPAYEPTTASVRSALDHLTDFTGRPDARGAGGGDSTTRPPNDGRPTAADLRHRHTSARVLARWRSERQS